MPAKPQPKKEVAIKFTLPDRARVIVMSASKDAIEEFREFGKIRHYQDDNEYWLTVDVRYDFDEVVEYIKNY